MKIRLFTSESVTEGHTDKMCDQISDAILDKLIEALENEENEVLLSEQEISDAHAPLLRMLELAK